ncbi:uncharacterized protein N7473_008785 [Penicillium subrubescens]|nr:uncharacterized protein N7473_008785 [Penicillium subrubescens]KAJ5886111.1 hypothetical protein N7473_008785 [Penicillium subrubescens]
MKSSALLAMAVSIAPLAAAWEIKWNDADDNDHTKSGHGPSDCIKIDNPKGHLFKIDAQGETDINMLLFTNSACSGEAAGKATDVFSKDASKDLLGFKVVSLSSTTGSGNSTTTTGGSTATGHNATTTGTTATTKTSGSTRASSTGGSTSAGSKSTQTTAVTSAAATTSSQASSSASSTSSSATSASTSNAAVRVAGSNADMVKGVLGGIVGLAAWII